MPRRKTLQRSVILKVVPRKPKQIETDYGLEKKRTMKKTLAMLLSLALCVGLFAGCSGGTTQETTPASEPTGTTETTPASESVELTGSVSTNGSTSMEEVMGTLIEAFREVQPGITVTYDPTGSGTGIEQVSAGNCDIGLSSRALTEDEIAGGITETVVAKDGIAIIVNPENTVTELTLDQIAQIATGAITNWSEVGGSDAPIAFVGREAGSGTRGAFEEITGTEDACVYSQELTSTGAVITAVSTTPGAIGYASLSAVEGAGDSVVAVGVKADDASPAVACTEETVLDGSYAIQRPFVFATRTDEALSEAAQAFVDFALDPANSQLYVDAGVVPAAE